MSLQVELTEDAAVMYMQEGMIHGELTALRIPRQPSSRDYIKNNPFLMKFMAKKVNDVVEWQGPALLEHIGPHKIKTILDIGCGIGLCSLSLYRSLDPKPTLFLCDGGKSLEGDTATYMESFTAGHDLVSDMRVTMDLLLRNGVPQEDINVIGPNVKNVSHLRDVDLVVSNVSWCYHYPPEVYWDGVRQAMHENSVMKVDVRVGPYAEPHPEYVDFFREKFHVVEELGVSGTPLRPDKTLSILAKHPKG